MKSFINWLAIAATSLFLFGGCTKKSSPVSPDKKKPVGAQTSDDKNRKDTSTAESTASTPPSSRSETTATTPTTPGQNPAPTSEPESSTPQPMPQPSKGLPTGPIKPIITTPTPADSAAEKPALPAQKQENQSSEDDTATKCFVESSEKNLSAYKNSGKSIQSPLDFTPLSNLVLSECKISDKTPVSKLLPKIISEAAIKIFPESEKTIRFYLDTELKLQENKITQESKLKLYSLFGVGVEIESKNVKFTGKLNPSKSAGSTLIYIVDAQNGSRMIKSRTLTKTEKSFEINLDKTPEKGVRYVFDFAPNQNQTYKLTIFEGDTGLPLQVQFEKGDLNKLKSNGDVILTLTRESWAQVMENVLRKRLYDEAPDSKELPLFYTREPKNSTDSRRCELKGKSMKCTDPDYESKVLVGSEK